ncbi:MAG: cellulase family glycosylhydrolase [Glaciimonas sp.]|nr:cellulase family glycosylhydrolase [Glaciimonas sp.]
MSGIGSTYGFAFGNSYSPVTAENFKETGMRGFAIDRVSSRADDEFYFKSLLSTNANVARIFFPFKKCINCTQYGRSPSDVAGLKKILDYLRPTGLKIVVVATFEDQDKPSFWTNVSLRSSFCANWRWFAETFQNDPAIAGLDLLNEPNPPGILKDAQELWHPLAAQAIYAIRSAGTRLPIVFEGVGGGQAIGMRGLTPFKDSEIVYSFHLYTPHDITHQKVSSAWPRSIPYPAGPEWKLKDAVIDVGGWNSNRLEESLKDVVAFQGRYNLPIFVGEFSCVRWAPNNSAQRYIEDSLKIFQKFGWSWCYHEFRGWPGWDAEIDSQDMSFTQRSSEAPIMKILLSAISIYAKRM